METIKINAGYANGWTPEQREILGRVMNILNKDPKATKTETTTGRCETATTWKNDYFELSWKVDSSD